MIIDATNAITGRLAAFSAKKALQGEDVVIVNAESAVISGKPENTILRYYTRRRLQNKADPEKSPKWPKKEHLLLKRIIKGMLPKHSSRGKQALSRIRVHIGTPEGLQKPEKFKYTSEALSSNFITLKDLCEAI